jgi:Uma2 family endonuclease
MKTTVAKLLESPDVVLRFEELREALEDEQRRREKFFEEVSENDKAEFINGEVFMHSPVRREHLEAVKNLATMMDAYIDQRGLGVVYTEKAMIELTRNAYEPDLSYFRQEKDARFKVGQLRFPAPDLIVEVLSASTERNDRGVKFADYAAHGVGEYWIVDPDAQILEQYLLQGEEYDLKLKSGDGRVRSRELEGFEIPINAIFNRQKKVAALEALLNRAQ